MKRYTARKRNINGEKLRVCALIASHARHLEDRVGYSDPQGKILRFILGELERNTHRGSR